MVDAAAGSPADVEQDVLALIAAGEVFAFEAMVDAASRSADPALRVTLDRMAVGHMAAYDSIDRRFADRGLDLRPIMQAHIGPLAGYHDRTRPTDELEALLKIYVGFGLSTDFGREVAGYLDADARDFVLAVLADPQPEDVIVERVRAVIAADPAAAGKLALWGRRLMGEALSQAQRVAADRPELIALVARQSDDVLTEFAEMLARLTAGHSVRMKRMGLAP